MPPSPAIAAERAAFIAASVPWSRRGEKSTTEAPSPSAASTTRAALVAIIVWKLIWLSSSVSISWAWMLAR